jgi:hypothetical protein
MIHVFLVCIFIFLEARTFFGDYNNVQYDHEYSSQYQKDPGKTCDACATKKQERTKVHGISRKAVDPLRDRLVDCNSTEIQNCHGHSNRSQQIDEASNKEPSRAQRNGQEDAISN